MLHRLDAKDFATVWQIMESSFPADEIRTCAEQRALLENSNYSIYTACEAHFPVAGFMAVWEFAAFAFLEHFAVIPACRNRNLGARMLHALSARMDRLLCLEVEPPGNDLARRRIAFYRRNNFYLNDFPYVQPPISKGKKAIPLCLMTSGSCVDEEQFDTIKGTLYAEVYGVA